MNLAADIGNTHIKLALFEGDELKEVWMDLASVGETLTKYPIRKAIISKTGANEEVEAYLKEKGVPTLFLNHTLKLPFKILYKTPATLGADRIAGSLASYRLFPNHNVLKVDFGTCITFDLITARGEYLGGSISPGVRMRLKALNHYTAGLPLVEVPQQGANGFNLTGDDTYSSIISGVMNGIWEEVQGIINQYDSRFDSLKVVGTGGDLHFFAALLKSEIFARPYLVLEGLNVILNYNS